MTHNGTIYYAFLTDANTKCGNISSHSESQDGHRILNKARLNHKYHNEGLKPMNNYWLILKVKIWRKM